MTNTEKMLALKQALDGWKTLDELKKLFGWRAHTVRGRMSDLGRSGSPVERKREGGITSYRLKQQAAEEAA